MTALLVPRYASDITSQWLTAALRERGLLGDGAVHRVYANDIGIGRGFVGRTLRLEIEYDQVVSGAPASLVAKLPSAIEQQDAGYAQLIAALYGNEIRWYRELAHDCPLRVPRAFWEGIDQADGRYCLLLEDVGHLAMFDQSTSCDDDTARCVVRAAADLHARWWTDPALVARNWLPGPEAHAAVLGGLFEQGWDRFWARLGSRLDPAFEEVDIRLRSELGRIVSELPAEHTTLIHSDYRIENFMFGTTGTPDELVVLDWQTVSLGSGPRDVAYFVGQSLTVEARRRLEWELLRLYHDRLLQNGVAGYVWEQCVQDYKRGRLIATQLPVNGAFRLEAIVPPANPQHRPYYDQAIATGEAMVLMLAQRAVAAVLDNDAVSVMD